MPKKSPFRGYTEEEVRTMESGYYILNFGGDFMLENGFYLFTQKEATKLYKDTLKNVMSVAKNGDEKERRYALDVLGKLIIQPMRLH
jgi:hypothetical protein